MTTAPPDKTTENCNNNIPFLLVLIAAGLAGNYLNFAIFPAVDFLFGSVFALLVLQLFGLGRGVFAAAVIAGSTYFIWNHPYAIIIFTAEVAVVGCLLQRRNVGVVLADVLYWLFIGMPLVYLLYHHAMKVSNETTYIIMGKQAVNGISNAMVARLFFIAYVHGLNVVLDRLNASNMLHKLVSAVGLPRADFTSYREIVFNILAFFVLCPTLITMAVDSRNEFKETELRITTALRQDSQRIAYRLDTWLENRKEAIIHLAEMAATKTPQQMQPFLELAKRSDTNFHYVGLRNREATTTAIFPLVDEAGQNNIGKNFADRPYIPLLKNTLKPMFSEVMLGRSGQPRPVIAVLAPVVVHGEYGGFVGAALNMLQMRDYLDKSVGRNTSFYTLLDKNGSVIMSNRSDQTPMKPFVRGKGTLNRLENSLSQWMPPLPPNTPRIIRWQNSSYVSEADIGKTSGLKLVLEQPVAPFQVALYKIYSDKLTLLFLILLGTLMIAEYISRKIVFTVSELRTLTYELPAKLAVDGESVVWPNSGIKEVRHLINNFREMSESLSEQFHEAQQINESLEQRVAERTAELDAVNAALMAEVSEHKLTLKALRDSKLLLEKTFSSLNEAIFIVETGTRVILDCNIACESMFGYSRCEMIGRTTAFLHISEEMSQRFASEMLQEYADKGFYETLFIMKRRDGTEFDSEHSVTPIIDDSGVIASHVCVVRDISERKKVEQALIESEAHYHLLVETSQDLIWQCDTEGRYTFLNLAWEQIFGYELDEMLGKRFSDFQPPEFAERDMVVFNQILEGNSINDFETTHLGKSGNEITLVFNAMFVSNEKGEIVGVSGTAYDITERKRMEEELRQSKIAAETANIAKSQFLATMSHEIRTPMNGVLGMIQLLQHSKLTQEQREYTDIAKSTGIKLVELLNDILDISKIEADKMELDSSPFDLRQLVSDTITIFMTQAREKDLQLVSSIDHDVPALIKSDAVRVRQIITNLVSNAIKFTRKGFVSIQIAKEAEDDRSVTIRFMVSDSGIGIPADKQAHIFEIFTQVDSSATREYGGTGLGLAISKRLAEMMGGSIGVESVDGEGSLFWFTVVMDKLKDGENQPDRLQPLCEVINGNLKSGNRRKQLHDPHDNSNITSCQNGQKYATIRILLVEDDSGAQIIVPKLLNKYGYQVDVAGNGKEALQALESVDYELVLMDCMMPGMNGYEVTAVIRDPESAVRRHDIPIIALTGNAMKHDRDKCLAAGMDDHLPKPFILPDLLAKLFSWLKE